MKRFFRFVYRLLKIAAVVVALILLAFLLMQQTTLTEQVGALSTRVHTLEQATAARPAPGSQAPDPSRTPTAAPTDTPRPAPTGTTTRTPTAAANDTPVPVPTGTPTRPPTATATDTPVPVPTGTPTRPPTATATDTPVAAPTRTATRPPTATATVTPVAAPTRTATRPPTATATVTPVPVPTRTATRPPTATATVTPVAAPHFIVNSDHVNVRRGPDPAFSIIGTVARGERFDIGARNNSGTWLEFCCVNDERGWIYAPLLIVSHDTSTIPVADIIPTPPSPTPTNTPVPPPPTNGGGGGSGNGLGVTIAPENRCSPYNAGDYSYPQSVERQIVAQQGGRIYGPYTGTYFASTGETDIEHIVARSEAHDSGLCAADSAARRAFGRDLLNLTLASPNVNRHQKIAKDVAEWLPALNQCWYVNQVVLVKRKYNLTMDQAEASKAQQVLASCAKPIVMQFTDPGSAPAPPPTAAPAPPPASGGNCESDPLGCYDDNNNGRITCAEARAHGIAPVPRGHPAYQYMRDGDSDGVVCE